MTSSSADGGRAAAPPFGGSVLSVFRRYSVLLIAAVIELVVVLLAPSTVPVVASGTTANPGTNSSLTDTAPDGGTSTVPGVSAPGAAGPAAGGANNVSVSGGATGPTTLAGGVVVGSGSSKGVVTSCPGAQPSPWQGYMPPCLKFSGINGGATMPGVTATAVTYTVFHNKAQNQAIQGVASATGLAFTEDQFCHAVNGFTKVLNSYYQTYGRKIVAVDGPGPHSGAAAGENCRANYFLGSACSDAPCWRADAQAIVRMKNRPTFVIGGDEATSGDFIDELTKNHIIVLGGGVVQGFTNLRSPYLWNRGMSGETMAQFGGDYFCRKLVGKPVKYAGTEVLTSGTNPTQPPIRKIGIVYDKFSPDSFAPSVRNFTNTLAGCGAKDVKVYSVGGADSTELAQSASTVSAKIKIDSRTTVYLFNDFLTAGLITNGLDSENWHPELVVGGVGANDIDRVMQLGNPNSMKYMWGLSSYNLSLPDTSYDFFKAYKASGEPGAPFTLMVNIWPWYAMLGSMVQVAGPSPTVGAIQQGMFHLPMLGGQDRAHSHYKFGLGNDSYFPTQSMREIYWCTDKTSPEDDKKGTFVGVLDSKWFKHGAFDAAMRIFPNGYC